MANTKAILIALAKSKPLYGLLAIGLTALGASQSEAISGLLFELVSGLPLE